MNGPGVCGSFFFFFPPTQLKEEKAALDLHNWILPLDICVCFLSTCFFFGLVSLTKEQRVTGWEPPPPPPGVPYFSVVVGFFLISTNRSARLLAVTRISNDAIDPGMVVHGISFLIFQSAVYNTKLEVKKRKKSYSLPYMCVYVVSRHGFLLRPLHFFFPLGRR